MRNLVLLVAFALASLGWAGQDATITSAPVDPPDAPKLTMEDAVAIGLANAFSIRLQAAETEQARQRVRQAYGQLGPRVTLSGQYLRFSGNAFSSQMGGTGGSGGGFAPDQYEDFTLNMPNDSKQVGVGVSQPIDITGVMRKAAEAAAFAEKAATSRLAAEGNTIKNQIRAQYLQVLQAREFIDVQVAAVAASEARLKNAQLREAAGEIAMFEVLRLDADFRNAQLQLLSARRNYDLAKQALNNLIGRPVETPFEPVPVTEMPPLRDTPDAFVEAGLVNRPEVQAAEFTGEAAKKAREAEEGGNHPRLNLGLNYTRIIDPYVGQSEDSTVGSAVVSFPVFDSGITRARVREARQNEEKAKIQLEQTQLGISLEVRQALTRAVTARQGLEVAQAALTAAAEALRLAQLRYENEVGIVLDVITAQAEYVRAQTNLVNARYDYLTAYAALQRAAGTDSLPISE